MDSKALVAAGIGALIPLLIGLLFIGPQVMEQRAAELTADLPATNARIEGLEKRIDQAIASGEEQRAIERAEIVRRIERLEEWCR